MEKKSPVTGERIYEEFEPITRWVPEPGFDTLIVYLPGFRKEQLKVQVTATRKLRVMGEHPGTGNKWVRFSKEFPIASSVDIDTISAKFEGVNLHIKFPKLEEKSSEKTKPSDHEAPKPQTQPSQAQQKTNDEQKQLASDQKRQKDGTEEQVGAKTPLDKQAGKGKTSNGTESVEEKETRSGQKQERVGGDSVQDAGKVLENQGKWSQKNYKQVLQGLVMEAKNRRKMPIGVALAAALVLVLGLYVSKRFGSSIGESEG